MNKYDLNAYYAWLDSLTEEEQNAVKDWKEGFSENDVIEKYPKLGTDLIMDLIQESHKYD